MDGLTEVEIIEICARGRRQDDARPQNQRDDAAKADATVLGSTPEWSLLATLAWIATRDLVAVARLIPRCPAYSGLFGPSGNLMWLVSELQTMPEADVVEPFAENALMGALGNGGVRATGYQNGRGTSATIPSEHWSRLAFRDGPSEPALYGDYAIRDSWMISESLEMYWTDIRFDRALVMGAFPSATADSSEAAPKSATAWAKVNRGAAERFLCENRKPITLMSTAAELEKRWRSHEGWPPRKVSTFRQALAEKAPR